MTGFVIGLFLVVACHLLRWTRAMRVFFALSLGWLFVWGTDSVPKKLGLWLENPYPPMPMEQVPQADVIVLLGGGMGPPKGVCLYPELFSAADRVWHAARLYHAGKAPVIMPSGCSEAGSSTVLLRELGVPASAIVVEDRAKNTIENGLFSKTLMEKNGYTNALLVTSAFHMRRSEMIFRTLGVRVFPVTADHEVLYGHQGSTTMYNWPAIAFSLPNAGTLDRSAWYLKELFGYWGDRWRLKNLYGHDQQDYGAAM